MHQLKHIVENGGASTEERSHEEVLQVLSLRLDGQEKTSMKERARRAIKRLSVHLGVVQEREVATASETWELSHFAAIFPPVVSGTQVDCEHFESGTVFTLFVLCMELLSTPLIQMIIQQKLLYAWQSWKSDPFETLGKLERMSY